MLQFVHAVHERNIAPACVSWTVEAHIHDAFDDRVSAILTAGVDSVDVVHTPAAGVELCDADTHI